ncbi:MAG: hypothetical protein ABIH23_07975 [bacterium]
MTKTQIAALACRILAVFVFVHALGFPLIPLISAIEQDRISARGLFVCWFLFGLILLSASLLWRLADRIAAHMTSDLQGPSINLGVNSEDVQRVGFSFVGLYLLGQSVPRLVNYLLMCYSLPTQRSSASWKANVAVLIVQIAIGLWLFFGWRGLTGLLNAMRKGSLADTENSPRHS